MAPRGTGATWFRCIAAAETERTAARLHQLLSEKITPPAIWEPKCERCSLIELCLPEAMSGRRSARRYLHEAIAGLSAPDRRGDPDV